MHEAAGCLHCGQPRKKMHIPPQISSLTPGASDPHAGFNVQASSRLSLNTFQYLPQKPAVYFPDKLLIVTFSAWNDR